MKLKNNEERKAWVSKYRDWGIWYKDEHIGATYYRYQFACGAVLIADEYHHKIDGYIDHEFDHADYHLIWEDDPTGLCHPSYSKHGDPLTAVVEFLKFAGKDEQETFEIEQESEGYPIYSVELPEKMEEWYDDDRDDYALGWNACIDAIMGGDNE